MKVKIDLKVIFILALYLFTMKKEVLTIAIISMILHEIGHILSGILLGMKIEKIKIHISGFLIKFANYGNKRRKNQILVSVSGPLVNIIIAILGIIIKNKTIIYTNMILALVNLLPIYPLDGGQIIKNILLGKTNYTKTIQTLETTSEIILILLSIISSIIILTVQNISIFILIIYLWYIHIKELQINKMIKRAYKTIRNNQ